MRVSAMIVAGAAAWLAAGAALAQQFPPDPPSVVKQAVVQMGAVDVLPDVVYSRPGGFRPLKLDLYKPHQPAAAPLPAVIWIHGGAWMAGDPKGGVFAGQDWPASLVELAGRGYVVASISYRFINEASFPAQAQDVRASIRFLRAHAAEYGIDASKVFISGGSAGGYLAVLAGATCGETRLDPVPPAGRAGGPPPPPPPAAGSECVQGVVAFYPITDMPAMGSFVGPNGARTDAPDSTVSRFLGCPLATCAADKLSLASVIGHLDAKDPPYLIFHGDADTLVPISQSRTLDAALKAKGVSSELVVVPGANHVFPGLDAAKRKEIMDRFYAFLDKASGKKR